MLRGQDEVVYIKWRVTPKEVSTGLGLRMGGFAFVCRSLFRSVECWHFECYNVDNEPFVWKGCPSVR